MKLVGITSDGTLPADTPLLPDIVPAVIASTVGLYARVGWAPPWIGYLAFEEGTCVGTCAFTGAPKSGEVEIAYFTFPGHERRGVATRMARHLVSLAATTAPEVVVTAHTLPAENPSTRILRRLGFEWACSRIHPEDGPIWVWRVQPNTAPSG
jgi:[ribosomal protein S5]-alanine N-acetyltransferase